MRATGSDSVECTDAVVWLIESARFIATLTRCTNDFGFAEGLAEEAVIDALC